MATVNSKEIVQEIIEGDGYYPLNGPPEERDPRVTRIVRYQNMFDGGTAYGLTYGDMGEDPSRYLHAPACHNPVIVWDAYDETLRAPLDY